jgi:hypothetical protein
VGRTSSESGPVAGPGLPGDEASFSVLSAEYLTGLVSNRL